MASEYLTAHEYATELKKLADEILACPDFQLGWSSDRVTMGICAEKNELLAFAKNLKPSRKIYSDNEIMLLFGSGKITAKITAARSVACRLIKPARPAEYDCEPLLSQAEEASL